MGLTGAGNLSSSDNTGLTGAGLTGGALSGGAVTGDGGGLIGDEDELAAAIRESLVFEERRRSATFSENVDIVD
jgi:hypothetical protein